MVSLLGGLVPARQTVQWRQALADDGEGQRWADPVEVPGCRIERRSKRIQTPEGRVVTITST
ncbi:MAG: hypothetical protein M3443_08095, partial [Actinomycetota bacterium]|nr:hypothetical protein [Actinomycetota bacterium]